MKKLSLSTILIAMILLTFAMALTPQVKANGTVVSVEPATVDIAAVGQTQTVDINITDVTNMYAYEMKIWYLRAIVNTTAGNVIRPVGHFMEPLLDPENFLEIIWSVNNAFNATHGRIYVGYTLTTTDESSKNGSGILLRISFTGVGVGPTPIVLGNYPGFGGPVNVADKLATPITHTVSNGAINVIPEIMMLLPIFAVTSLIAVSLAKLRKKKQLQ